MLAADAPQVREKARRACWGRASEDTTRYTVLVTAFASADIVVDSGTSELLVRLHSEAGLTVHTASHDDDEDTVTRPAMDSCWATLTLVTADGGVMRETSGALGGMTITVADARPDRVSLEVTATETDRTVPFA